MLKTKHIDRALKQEQRQKRGSTLQRTEFKRKPPAPHVAPERAPVVHTPPLAWRIGTVVSPHPRPAAKTVAHRNARLLDLARGMPCLFMVPGVCCGDPDTTVAAHSNWHDKAGARKASDFLSAWACYACHTWLDQLATATGEQKRAAFDRAHAFQVVYWRQIAADPRRPDPDRAACRWALDLLKSQPTKETT